MKIIKSNKPTKKLIDEAEEKMFNYLAEKYPDLNWSIGAEKINITTFGDIEEKFIAGANEIINNKD